MASSVPPVKNAAFSFEVALTDQSDTDVFKSTPTLAAGDVKVFKDGGAAANIGTLPTEISVGVLTVALTADEMNADRVCVLFADAAGDEWQSLLVTIHTAAQTLDTTDAAVDANGTALAALNDLDAAGVRTAIGMASANLDTQLSTIQADLDSPNQYKANVSGLAALNWSYPTRTLTTAVASGDDVLDGTLITVQRLTSWSIEITGLGDLSSRTKLYFTMKAEEADADSEAILQVEESAGLLYVNGAAASDNTKATLAVDDETNGDITISVSLDVTTMDTQRGIYDVKMLTATGGAQKTAGNYRIQSITTKAVT